MVMFRSFYQNTFFNTILFINIRYYKNIIFRILINSKNVMPVLVFEEIILKNTQ